MMSSTIEAFNNLSYLSSRIFKILVFKCGASVGIRTLKMRKKIYKYYFTQIYLFTAWFT
jgi:hypothetical protein